MSVAMKARRTLLALLGALIAMAALVITGNVTGVLAASGKADFTLAVTPASKSVSKGTVASYTVTMTPNNGYAGTVALSATPQSGSGASASFTASTVNSKSPTTTLNVGTANASTGTWSITVSGTDGALTHPASASLTVTAAAPQFTLGATPSSATLLPGDIAQYSVTITRQAPYTSPVALSVSGLPSGASSSFAPASPVSGASTTLQVSTTSSTPTGSFPLTISGASSGASAQNTTVQLVVSDKGKTFAISGAPSGSLAPGSPPEPINLTLSNPNNQTLNITNLTVTVTGTAGGSACPVSNFAVTQFSGAYPVVLGKGQTATLTQLGFATSALPKLALLNDSTHNQDGCKSVHVFLSYSGSGQGPS